MKTRTALCFLAALMAISAATVSCGGDTPSANDPQVTEAPKVTEAETEFRYRAEYLPDANYDGSDYRIIGYYEYPADVEQESGNIIDDAIYRRNRLVEEQYNINIVETKYNYANYDDVNALMKKNGLAAADDFDLYKVVMRHAIDGVLTNIVPVVSDMPYVDISQPWYMNMMNEGMIIGGMQIIAYTAFDQNPGGSCILFNKHMINDLQLDMPYTLVDSDKWTYDAMLNMAVEAIADLDGDGKMTEADRFAFISNPGGITEFMYFGSGAHLADYSGDIPVIVKDEQLFDMYNQLVEFCKIDGFYFDIFTVYGWSEDSRPKGVKFFENGGALFCQSSTNSLPTLGNMKDDYGILPYPKWTEDQKDYHSPKSNGVIAVPLTCSADLARVCIIKEALAVESLNINHPAYYDVALKDRYIRDEESLRMLELITKTVSIDLGEEINTNLSVTPWMNCLQDRKGDVASALTKIEKQAAKTFNQIADQIAALKENN